MRLSSRAFGLGRYLTLVATVAACGGDPADPADPAGPATGSPPPTFRLETAIGSGVSGTPGAAVTTHAQGATVHYAFAPAAGYTGLRVMLDEQAVGASGDIRMDRAHTLLASADSSLEVPPGDELLMQKATALLTASDPVAAVEALGRELAALYARNTPANAARRAQVIRALAYDPVRDSAALRRVDDALQNHVIDIDGTVTDPKTQAPRVAASRGSDATTFPLTFVYINGIATDGYDAAADLQMLKSTVQDAGFQLGPSDNLVRLYYNRSAGDLGVGKGLCEIRMTSRMLFSGFLALDDLARCAAAYAGDLAESLSQVLLATPLTRDVDRLVAMIREEYASGHGVVIVAHSQGNLFAQEAIRRIVSEGATTMVPPSSCLGMISLASPVSGYPTTEVARVDSLVIAGTLTRDIILVLPEILDAGDRAKLPRNRYAPFPTNLTGEYDRIMAGPWYARPVTPYGYDLRLHSFVTSYLVDQVAHDKMVAALKGQRDAIRGACTTARRLTLVSGDAQIGAPGATLAAPLVVRATTDAGAPAANAKITFSVTSGGGSVSPATVTTDANGEARSTWVLGPTLGTQAAIASTTSPKLTGSPISFIATATQAGAGLRFVKLTGGGNHACGLTAAGAAYCWGQNGYGQLGGGEAVGYRLTPGRVVATLPFIDIAASQNATCGIEADSLAYCWGALVQLGEPRRDVPVRVPGEVKFKQISAGLTHACGLTSGGEVYCWGDGGVLGDGTWDAHVMATRVAGDQRFSSISVGWGTTCAVTTDQRAMCWGNAVSGPVGVAGLLQALAPVEVSGGLRFESVAVGNAQACGTTPGGPTYCWGAMDQRGSGSNINPTATPTGVLGGYRFDVLSARTHACGIASPGTFCWGYGSYGDLGTGDTDSRDRPSAVQSNVRFTSLTTGGNFTCALTVDLVRYCWGRNSDGQFGDGTTADATVPKRVTDVPPS